MTLTQRLFMAVLLLLVGLSAVYIVATADRVLPPHLRPWVAATATPPRSRDAAATLQEVQVFAAACGDLLERDYVDALQELTAPDFYLTRFRDRLFELVTIYRRSVRDAATREQVIQAFERHLDSVGPLILEYEVDLTPLLAQAGCWPTTSLGGYYEQIGRTWQRQGTWQQRPLQR